MDEQVVSTVWAMTLWSVVIAVVLLGVAILRGFPAVIAPRQGRSFSSRMLAEVPWGVLLLTVAGLVLIGPRLVYGHIYPGELYSNTLGSAIGDVVLIWIAANGLYVGLLLIAGYLTDRVLVRIEERSGGTAVSPTAPTV